MDHQNIECMWMLSDNGFIDDFLHLGILSSTVIATKLAYQPSLAVLGMRSALERGTGIAMIDVLASSVRTPSLSYVDSSCLWLTLCVSLVSVSQIGSSVYHTLIPDL